MGRVVTAARPTHNVLGAVLLAASWIFFTTEMVAVRLLAGDLSVAQIAVFRLCAQVIALVPVLAFTGAALFRTARLPLHFGRACCSAVGMLAFYLAFALLPLAVATTLTFLQAIFVLVLAALLLGETIGPRRIGAVVAGFAGVLIVMRPGLAAVEPGMLIALGGALVAALLMIVTRSLSATESRLTIMLYSALLGIGLLAVPALLTWRTLEVHHLPLLALVGAAGTTGQFLMVGAFQVAEASALAPVDYVRLIFAVIAGYVIFDELPDLWTWAGAAVILGSVAYAAHRERLAARKLSMSRTDAL